MAGEVHVDPAQVSKMLDILRAAAERVAVLKVSKPNAADFGGSDTGRELASLTEAATDRITTTLSNLEQTLDDFGAAIRAAQKAVTGSDEDIAAYGNKMAAGLELMNQPFFENLGKDKRVQVSDIPLLPGLGELLTQAAAGQQFDGQGRQPS